MSGRHVPVGPVVFGNDLPFVLVSGPCQIEGRDHALRLAERLAAIAAAAGVPFVFKSSFDKANRTALGGRRGVGLDAGLAVLAAVKAAIGCPVLTDIHAPDQAATVAEVADILQIPAFLCRQTDLLLAAGATGRAVNIKKGQFLAPADMAHAAAKVAASGNERILLCDRGTSFGYNALVTDLRALPVMAATGYPTMFDATHSTQSPGGEGGRSGGDRAYAPLLARAAVAAGTAAVFAEAHDDPDRAPSDGPVMLPLEWVAPMLADLVAIDGIAKARSAGFGH
jgi:2-dehydro-3-deoxyphosphooctonate aldolase (KDO 8-P synthase)